MQKAASGGTISYGWCIVAVTSCMALVTVGARTACGVFVVPMEAEFGWNRSTISLAKQHLQHTANT